MRRLLRGRLPVILLGLAAAWMARSMHESGHGWGDDFALYINQARGLADGSLWGVVADNRFGLNNSAWDYYSPLAYPWLFPLLLMPIIAVVGVDLELLKWVPTLAFVTMVLSTLVLSRRRLDPTTTTIVVVLVALNPWYLGATDAILSDLVFVAVVLVSLVLLDRAVEQRRVFSPGLGPMIGAAVMIAAAFHIRREALGLGLALAVVQLMAFRSQEQPVARRQLLAPWAVLIGAVGGFHLLLPAPLLATEAPGGGLSQIPHHLAWYREPLAELIGLKDIGDNPVSALGSSTIGHLLFWAIIGLAAIGAGAAVASVIARRHTVAPHLVAALLGIGTIVMVAPYQYQRYIYTVAVLTPIVAASGLRTIVRVRSRFTLVPVLSLLILGVPAAQHVTNTVRTLDYHRSYEYTHWGPTHPDVVELFDAVERLTDERDVVVFFQARSMNLFTGRLSIQGNNEQMMVERGDWYAQERDSDYIQTPLTTERAAELGFEAVWSNNRFILWRIPEFEAPVISP